ncbi:MAG: hypothetical protein HC835_11590 [Oscillatoriales cyanobacterium RM2_1_1]|nr:hypothetical protein [Oscillatoriales cyanobacterium SM2_3_0]NJO46217.1 hypothetical protein [Oscillatoriales cyanobacterium RM2_1_1]
MYEYEFEAALEPEYECEFASEYEDEQFLPLLAPALKLAAPAAIKAIGGLFKKRRRRRGQREFEFELETLGEFEDEYEYEYEADPFIGNLLKGLGGALLGEGEFEFEDELELEMVPQSEYELMMEHLAYQAANSESEAEAEAFLGALASMATRLVPHAAKAISRVTPTLVRGIARAGKALHRSPTTRKLLQTMPTVAKGTVRTLARQVERGKPVTSKTALRALAGNVANVLGDPKKATKCMQKSHRAQHQHQLRTTQRKRQLARA